MRNKLIFIIIILLIGFPITICAENIRCDYANGVSIIYNNGQVSIDQNLLETSWYTVDSILYNSTADFYTKEEIDIKQEELKSILGEYYCPEKIYLCEQTICGIEQPSLLNLGNAIIGKPLTSILDFFAETNLSSYTEDCWSLLLAGKTNLTVMGQDTYEKDFEENVGTMLTATPIKNAQEAVEWCDMGDDIPVVEQAQDLVCGLGWGILTFAYDSIISDDNTLLSLESLDCKIYTYPEDGPYQPLNTDCYSLSINLRILQKQIEGYKSCNDDYQCKLSSVADIYKTKEKVSNICNLIFQEFSYKGSKKNCIDDCLNLNKLLKDVDEYKTTITCGFTGRLILFVGNIIKWCKYIVPVIAIVLGILDFIKAIGTGKEDEMKKAQGKFIKRLIVAGLVFIMPFIIEFILNKMGFEANGCGIIDL